MNVVVVGKVILDKYGNPSVVEDDGSAELTIGGGGPQAAWGACASLAARQLLPEWEPTVAVRGTSPPKQPVTFLAPIGTKNWAPEMTNALNSLLPMLETEPILATSAEHITPTINIWHDENEVVNWLPVDGSFGEVGASGLWANRPCADDILDAIKGYEGNILLHAILEAGHKGTGGGMDALPFFDPSLVERLSAASIEPIIFPDESTGLVSAEDSRAVIRLVEKVSASLSAGCMSKGDEKMLLVSPDRPCYEALISDESFATDSKAEFAVRNGANGSFANEVIVPAATLRTPDGKPINPTGAGNAYAAAYAACRASGSCIEEAASLANAVGAVVCEYDNIPPWSWEVVERVAEGAREVRSKVRQLHRIDAAV